MHIHNVADYAPQGHKLLRTDYAGGKTCHVFVDESGKEIALEVIASNADEERGYLEAFKAMHEKRAPADGGNAGRDFQGNGQGLDED